MTSSSPTTFLPHIPPDLPEMASVMAPEAMSKEETADALASSVSITYEPGNFYASILATMISTVLEDETHLFSDTEGELLRAVLAIPRTARALLAHLLQRQDRFLPTGSLAYRDVPDPHASVAILHEKQLVLVQPASSLDWPELLGRLSLDNLRALMPRSTYLSKAAMVQALVEAPARAPPPLQAPARPARQLHEAQPTARQLTLFQFKRSSPTAPTLKAKPATAPPLPPTDRPVLARDHIRPRAEVMVGPSVRVRDSVRELIDRTALLYYRELPEPAKPANMSWSRPRPTARGEESLTTAILARSGRRRFATYCMQRSPLWNSRDEVVAFYRAVEREREMECFIEMGNWEDGAEAGLEVLREWEDAVRQAQEEEGQIQLLSSWRIRFHAAHVQTRVLYKAATCLGRLKRYEEEAQLLQSLLNQRIFRQHKRGEWVERLALIWMQYAPAHFPPAPHARRSSKATQVSREYALRLCVEAVEDPRTHALYLPALQRRILRLEGLLRTPFSDQHDFSHMALREAKTVHFTAVRLDRMAPVTDDRGLWGQAPATSDASERPPPQKRVRLERTTADQQRETYHTQTRLGMGTVWRGLDGHGCRVEDLVLQHYVQAGYRGYHCEGGLVHMLISLLLWDVLFAPVRGVFQSPFQPAPLDLRSADFVRSRADMLATVLAEVERRGPDMVAEVDAAHRPSAPHVVGCHWDSYSHDDLVQVAEALGGEALAQFCRAFADDWGASTSGLPDLLVWQHPDHGAARARIKLVEVKGPGDQLRENQKRWIDLLCMWGVPVELALVREET